MHSPEQPSEKLVVAENQEQTAERVPEQVVGAGVAAVESREAADPVISSEWWKKSKEFMGKAYESRISAVARVGLIYLPFKITLGLLKFAKEAIVKKGNVGFKSGYEIGKDAFSFDGKGDKK